MIKLGNIIKESLNQKQLDDIFLRISKKILKPAQYAVQDLITISLYNYYVGNAKQGLIAKYKSNKYKPFFDAIQNTFRNQYGENPILYRGLYFPNFGESSTKTYDDIIKHKLLDYIDIVAQQSSITGWTDDMDVALSFSKGSEAYTAGATKMDLPPPSSFKYDGIGIICATKINYKNVIFYHDAIDEETTYNAYFPGIVRKEKEVIVHTSRPIQAKIIKAHVYNSLNISVLKKNWLEMEKEQTFAEQIEQKIQALINKKYNK